MVLMLMRHPHTLANQQKTFPRYNKSPYSEQGQREIIETLKRDFNVEQILSSPYERARKIAEAIGEKEQIPVRIVDVLREVDMGDFGGKTFQEIQRDFPEETKAWLQDPEHFRYPGGDALSERRDQLREVLQSLDRDTLIISHQAILYSLTDMLGDKKSFSTGEIITYEL